VGAVTGSYLAIYWILAGHHDAWNRWAVKQVNWLHENGRMFKERDHIHTLLYNYEWGVQRDPDGVSAELALDHRFPGLAVVVGEVAEGSSHDELARWYKEEYLPGTLSPDSPIALWLSFTARPLLFNAPGDVPRTEGVERRFLQLVFLARATGSRSRCTAKPKREGAQTQAAGAVRRYPVTTGRLTSRYAWLPAPRQGSAGPLRCGLARRVRRWQPSIWRPMALRRRQG